MRPTLSRGFPLPGPRDRVTRGGYPAIVTWTRCAKIAFIGSHGIRKTTAAHAFAGTVQRAGRSVEFAREVVRDNPLGINESATGEAQLWVLMSQIRQELELAPKAQVLVTDRAAMDNHAYYLRACGGVDRFAVTPLVTAWAGTYDLVVRLLPDIPLRADGTRSTADAFRDEVETILDATLPGMVTAARLMAMPASAVARRRRLVADRGASRGTGRRAAAGTRHRTASSPGRSPSCPPAFDPCRDGPPDAARPRRKRLVSRIGLAPERHRREIRPVTGVEAEPARLRAAGRRRDGVAGVAVTGQGGALVLDDAERGASLQLEALVDGHPAPPVVELATPTWSHVRAEAGGSVGFVIAKRGPRDAVIRVHVRGPASGTSTVDVTVTLRADHVEGTPGTPRAPGAAGAPATPALRALPVLGLAWETTGAPAGATVVRLDLCESRSWWLVDRAWRVELGNRAGRLRPSSITASGWVPGMWTGPRPAAVGDRCPRSADGARCRCHAGHPRPRVGCLAAAP